MKVGIVGKGGVGKTTVSALLSQGFEGRHRRVLAIDTDSNPNLGMSLGLSLAETEAIPVIPRQLVVGGAAISTQALLDEFGRTTPAGVVLLSAMRVDQAGAGCTCGHHAAVRSLLGRTIDEHADVTIVDMEAGLEHLSRSGGTLAAADILVVVMEPSRKSVVTAARTMALADELGIPRTVAVGNKAHLPEDVEFFEQACAEYGVELCAVIPFDPSVAEADRHGRALGAEATQAVGSTIEAMLDFLDAATAPQPA